MLGCSTQFMLSDFSKELERKRANPDLTQNPVLLSRLLAIAEGYVGVTSQLEDQRLRATCAMLGPR